MNKYLFVKNKKNVIKENLQYPFNAKAAQK